jgi:nicotinamidase/pyrazinamidase
MRMDRTLFWDVDTQRDFILPDGALHGPTSLRIVGTLGALTQLARERGVRIVATVCRHFPGDAELKPSGGLYPNHCMNGTPGQLKIDETRPLNPTFIENRQMSDGEIVAVIAAPGDLVIEKQDLDVMRGNRNAARLLPALLERYDDVVIYGVFTDLCVDIAVRNLMPYGRRLHVVSDAIAPLDERKAAEAIAHWRRSGVELLTLAQLRERLSA